MPSSVCLDASFVVRLLESDSLDAPALRLWRTWVAQEYTFVAPVLLPFEVTNALYRYVRYGNLSQATAQSLMQEVFELGIQFYADPELHLEALALAHELNLPAAYDAHYLALARRMNAEFWTADQRLAKAVAQRFSWVHVLA